MNEKATEIRTLIRREFNYPEIRLRRIFKIPDDEMITSFEWDKDWSVLRMVTLKDYDEKEQSSQSGHSDNGDD